MPEKVIVIGAGLGGLAAASLLAADGYDVCLFEKNSTPGGKMQQVVAEGFRFDTGPSLLTMPFTLEKLFERCGKNIHNYLSWTNLSPLCRYFYSDGVQFDNYSARSKSMEEIKRFAPEDAAAYAEFLGHAENLYERTAGAFLFNPLYDFTDLRSLNLIDFLQIDAFSTVSEKVDEFFQSGYLRQFFKRFTTYNGSSPYQAPATLNVIPHVELNQGGYYVKGGLYQVAITLHEMATQLGVKFHFDTQISAISAEMNRVNGVITKEGEFISCDLLFANSDSSHTILNLLPEFSVSEKKIKKHQSIEPSCSGFVMLLGCGRQWEQLRHHNIFFSNDYRQEFDDIFGHHRLPEDPTIYVANTSYSEPEHAPANSSNLFVLVNAPYIAGDHDWPQISRKYSQFLINQLETRGLQQLRESIEYCEIINPEDFLQKYNSNRGSIYGTSSNSKFAAFLRPRNKLRDFENLYMVGGSTHPGGGIPLVIQSAFNAMELLRRD